LRLRRAGSQQSACQRGAGDQRGGGRPREHHSQAGLPM
jgi:hypothetical protein